MANLYPIPTLETDRLLLTELSHADSDLVFRLRTDPVVNRYVERPAPKDTKEAQEFIDYIIGQMQQGRILYWSMILPDQDIRIGTICFWNFSEDRKTVEVGYDLLPDFHQKGLMSEALEAVLQFGVERLGVETVEGFTDKENFSSRKLLERIGFSELPDRRDPTFPNNVIYAWRKG